MLPNPSLDALTETGKWRNAQNTQFICRAARLRNSLLTAEPWISPQSFRATVVTPKSDQLAESWVSMRTAKQRQNSCSITRLEPPSPLIQLQHVLGEVKMVQSNTEQAASGLRSPTSEPATKLERYVSTAARQFAPGNFVTTWNPEIGRDAVGVTRAIADDQEANPLILVKWMHDLSEEWVRSEYLYRA